jgi:hypothetical protein
MFQIKTRRENQNDNLNNFIFENRVVYEIMWENIVQPDRPHTILWRMRIACWITKATDTHLEYVIFTRISTATMVMRTRLNIMLISTHCPQEAMKIFEQTLAMFKLYRKIKMAQDMEN